MLTNHFLSLLTRQLTPHNLLLRSCGNPHTFKVRPCSRIRQFKFKINLFSLPHLQKKPLVVGDFKSGAGRNSRPLAALLVSGSYTADAESPSHQTVLSAAS
jgi:hypothetical protein